MTAEDEILSPSLVRHGLVAIPVAPVGRYVGPAFVSYRCGPECERTRPMGHGGVEDIDVPRYPPSPRGDALRDVAAKSGLYGGEAARRLGLSPVEYYGLTHGSHTLSEADWREAERRLLVPLTAGEQRMRAGRAA